MINPALASLAWERLHSGGPAIAVTESAKPIPRQQRPATSVPLTPQPAQPPTAAALFSRQGSRRSAAAPESPIEASPPTRQRRPLPTRRILQSLELPLDSTLRSLPNTHHPPHAARPAHSLPLRRFPPLNPCTRKLASGFALVNGCARSFSCQSPIGSRLATFTFTLTRTNATTPTVPCASHPPVAKAPSGFHAPVTPQHPPPADAAIPSLLRRSLMSPTATPTYNRHSPLHAHSPQLHRATFLPRRIL